jgi:hypothetical protein
MLKLTSLVKEKNMAKGLTIIYKTLDWKLKFEHHEPSQNTGMNSALYTYYIVMEINGELVCFHSSILP